MFETNAERQRKLAELKSFFEKQKDGALVTWLEIEQATGIRMRSKDEGRRLVTEVLRRKLRRPYAVKPGTGIELSSPANAADIAERGRDLVINAARRMEKTGAQLEKLHGSQMTTTQRDRFARAQSFNGTLAALVVSRPKELKASE